MSSKKGDNKGWNKGKDSADAKSRDSSRRAHPEQIVRLLNTDLDGARSIGNSLRKIKGVSFAMTNAILKSISISPSTLTSELTEEQIDTIEKMIKNPGESKIPSYMVNVQRDLDDDENRHLTGSELTIYHRNKISFLQKLGNYRGIRHRTGKKVRGQRTRSSGRGTGSVGVSKKKK